MLAINISCQVLKTGFYTCTCIIIANRLLFFPQINSGLATPNFIFVCHPLGDWKPTPLRGKKINTPPPPKKVSYGGIYAINFFHGKKFSYWPTPQKMEKLPETWIFLQLWSIQGGNASSTKYEVELRICCPSCSRHFLRTDVLVPSGSSRTTHVTWICHTPDPGSFRTSDLKVCWASRSK